VYDLLNGPVPVTLSGR